MASGSPLALNLVLLLFFLMPGYLLLRGYLDATVQLDSLSRLDKIVWTVGGGVFVLIMMLVANRFGVLRYLSDFWTCYFEPNCTRTSLGYDATRAVKVGNAGDFSSLAILGFVVLESGFGYVSGYLLGTGKRIKSNNPQNAREDLEQPWEVAIQQSDRGDEISVVTINEMEVKGKLYRAGSPSEDSTILLYSAEEIKEEEENKPIGTSYHHHRDISQVRFPRVKRKGPGPEKNWILRQKNRLVRWHRHKKRIEWEFLYRMKLEDYLNEESAKAVTLVKYLRERDD